MDPITSKLNQLAGQKVNTLKSPLSELPRNSNITSPFQQKLDTHMMEKVLDKIEESYGLGKSKNDVKTLSAGDIHVETKTSQEVEASKGTFSLEEKFYASVGDLNSGFNNMDSMLEMINSPNFKFDQKNLLATQFAFGKISFALEAGSKMLDSAVRGVQAITQTNVG